MRRVENLTENKVLINTFKKLKTRNYLNRSFLKKRDFFFLKFKQFDLPFLFKNFSKKNYILLSFKKTFKNSCVRFFFHKNEKNYNFFKTLLMFVK